jgi:hypothetical protein
VHKEGEGDLVHVWTSFRIRIRRPPVCHAPGNRGAKRAREGSEEQECIEAV